ncbi:MAG: NPCBM/NEW2 domain-containing protein [Planctomycetes bacterium]|nr:NPCBM/NEW2 domain-containing protein [Planctomycetota bacterium]
MSRAPTIFTLAACLTGSALAADTPPLVVTRGHAATAADPRIENGQLRISASVKPVSLDDLVLIQFNPPARRLAPLAWICLFNGMQVSGQRLQLTGEGAALTSGNETTFAAPQDQIAAVFFQAARPVFEPPPAGIRIISANGDVLDAPFAEINAQGVFIDINPDVDLVHLPPDRLAAIVWPARLAEPLTDRALPARIALRTGQVLPGRLLALDDQILHVETETGPCEIPRRELAAIQSAAVRLVPARPVPTPPDDAFRPAWRVDSDALGLPLRIGGRSFSHGIGLRAPARVVLPVPDHVRWFIALAGADDDAAPFARVTVEIHADDRLTWKLEAATPGKPGQYAAVNVRGGRTVTLIVRSAENSDTACLGDFAHAAFIID